MAVEITISSSAAMQLGTLLGDGTEPSNRSVNINSMNSQCASVVLAGGQLVSHGMLPALHIGGTGDYPKSSNPGNVEGSKSLDKSDSVAGHWCADIENNFDAKSESILPNETKVADSVGQIIELEDNGNIRFNYEDGYTVVVDLQGYTTETFPDASKVTKDPDLRVTQITDSEGSSINIEYNEGDLDPIRITSNKGQLVKNDRVGGWTIHDRAGNSIDLVDSVTVEDNGDIRIGKNGSIAVKHINGRTTEVLPDASQVCRDSQERVTRITDGDGNALEIEYNGDDPDPIKITGKNGQFVRDESGEGWALLDQAGNFIEKVDSIEVCDSGDISVSKDGSTEVTHPNGTTTTHSMPIYLGQGRQAVAGPAEKDLGKAIDTSCGDEQFEKFEWQPMLLPY